MLLRARAHPLLLAAALLTVVLTTAVLATLTAYSGSVGDAALRHALADPRNAADTSLVVEADVPEEERGTADATVREGSRDTFCGLPVTVRTLTQSGPYALPGTPRPRDGGGDDPDLTYFAALDPAQVRVTEGRMPAESDGERPGRAPDGSRSRCPRPPPNAWASGGAPASPSPTASAVRRRTSRSPASTARPTRRPPTGGWTTWPGAA
ncbi:hypothetical protein ACWEWP_03420 [Streptomyces olivaceus]